MSTFSLLQSPTVVDGAAPALIETTGGWIVESVGVLPAESLAVAALTVGVLGMSIRSVFESLLSDESNNADSAERSDDGLMPEEGSDDLDELGGGFGGGDDFGGFEDDFGDMDGGADTDELEHRLDELETEVGSLSSTVNTVRNENEQISETVDNVEENVRKLLDIYEMVTRGVNPFADDIDAGGFGGPGDDSFGLFDDGSDQSEEGDLDEDIANADAEGFFDEDLVEEDEDLETDTDMSDVLGTGEGGGDDGFADDFEDDFEDDFDMDDDFGDDVEDDFDMDDGDDVGAEDGGSEGGKSFAELKDEYESGDAEWAEGDDTLADGDDLDDESEEGDALEEDDALEDGVDIAASDATGDSLADDELFDTVIEGEEDSGATAGDGDEEPDTGTTPAEDASNESAQPAEDGTASSGDGQTESADGKPYLTELPDGFLADLIVVEWLEFLVGEVGIRATTEAVDYYERIDWIDESVADQLQAYLNGFEESGESASLTIDHHTRSLRYVSQLNGGGAESIALEQVPRQTGGGPDGIQR